MTEENVSAEFFALYFSPYSAHAISWEGELYPTVEHAYHASRYDDEALRRLIIRAKSPLLAWQISKEHKHLQIADFQARKVGLMKELCREKCLQHEDVDKALRGTGTKHIVKHISTYPPGDGFWDDGLHGEGENQFGKLWMELREELSL